MKNWNIFLGECSTFDFKIVKILETSIALFVQVFFYTIHIDGWLTFTLVHPKKIQSYNKTNTLQAEVNGQILYQLCIQPLCFDAIPKSCLRNQLYAYGESRKLMAANMDKQSKSHPKFQINNDQGKEFALSSTEIKAGKRLRDDKKQNDYTNRSCQLPSS